MKANISKSVSHWEKCKRRRWRWEKWGARTTVSISERVTWSYHLHQKYKTRRFDLTHSIYLNLETENFRQIIANQIRRNDYKHPDWSECK